MSFLLNSYLFEVAAGGGSATIVAHPDLLFLEGLDAWNDAHNGYGMWQRYTMEPINNFLGFFTGRFGAGRAIRTTVNDPRRFVRAISAQSRLCVGFASRFSAAAATTTILSFKSGATNVINLMVNTSRGITVSNSALVAFGSTANALITISPVTWHYIEMEVVADASAGEIRVWIDGVLRLNLSGLNTGTSYDAVAFTCSDALDSGTGSSTSHAMDDIYCAKQALLPTVPKRVITLRPDEDVSPNSWTPNSGTDHHAVVNKSFLPSITNNDTGNTYLTTSGDNQEEIFGLDALPFTPLHIFGAQVDASVRRLDTTSDTTYRHRALTSLSDLDGPTVTENGTNSYRMRPSTGQAADGALLIDIDGDISDLKIGIEALDASPQLRCQAMFLQVLVSVEPDIESVEFTFSAELTIAAGEVASDLTNFPVYVDLSDMPANFWSNVETDGGDIRVFQSNGTTQIPFDLVAIDTGAQTGKLFFKADLLSASDNVFIIKSGDPVLDLLLSVDPYGRDAVWEDYDRVFVFPSTADRTGNGGTVTLSGTSFAADGSLSLAGAGFGKASASRFTTWTMGVTVTPGSVGATQGVLSYSQSETADTSRATLAIRGVPNNYGLWNSSDSWVSFETPAVSTPRRLHGTQDGTTHRKLYASGASTTDAGVTQRPAGASAVFLYLGKSDETAAEFLTGTLQFVYLRDGELSADWITAEDINCLTPSSFYTIAEL